MADPSLAYRDIPSPDYVHTSTAPLGPEASTDPAEWASRMFSVRTMPRWVVAAVAVRQALVPLLGIRRAPRGTFRISATEDDEALIAVDDTHLDFRCGVAVDDAERLVRVTTTVRLHNGRGRLYFAPVRIAHPFVVRSMLRSTARSFRRGR